MFAKLSDLLRILRARFMRKWDIVYWVGFSPCFWGSKHSSLIRDLVTQFSNYFPRKCFLYFQLIRSCQDVIKCIRKTMKVQNAVIYLSTYIVKLEYGTHLRQLRNPISLSQPTVAVYWLRFWVRLDWEAFWHVYLILVLTQKFRMVPKYKGLTVKNRLKA